MAMAGNGLVKLLEELGELSQIAAKKLAYYNTDIHPDGKGSMKLRLQEEMGDVLAAIALVTEQFKLDDQAISARAENKIELFLSWTRDSSNVNDAPKFE